MTHLGFKVKWVDHGCDNSGGFLKKSTGDADFKVIVDDDPPLLLEVKQNFDDTKATFKDQDLLQYIKQKATILLVLGTGLDRHVKSEDFEGVWNRNKHRRVWSYVYPYRIKTIRESIPAVKISAWGNKPARVVNETVFDRFFELQKFRYV